MLVLAFEATGYLIQTNSPFQFDFSNPKLLCKQRLFHLAYAKKNNANFIQAFYLAYTKKSTANFALKPSFASRKNHLCFQLKFSGGCAEKIRLKHINIMHQLRGKCRTKGTSTNEVDIIKRFKRKISLVL